jgi:hypothetical protein
MDRINRKFFKLILILLLGGHAEVFSQTYKNLPPQFKVDSIENSSQDITFTDNSITCSISKDEIIKAKEQVIRRTFYKIDSVLIAIKILKFRFDQKDSLQKLNCSISFFNIVFDQMLSMSRTYNNGGEFRSAARELGKMAIDLMNKIIADPNYNELLGRAPSSEILSRLFFPAQDDVELLENVRTEHARVLFKSMVLKDNMPVRNNIGIKLLLKLYYQKSIVPEQEVKNSFKVFFKYHREISPKFLEMYLDNVNQLAYDDLFKELFIHHSDVFLDHSYFEKYKDNYEKIKLLYSSSFLPEDFKCAFTKNVFLKDLSNVAFENKNDLLNVSSKCFQDSIQLKNNLIVVKGQQLQSCNSFNVDNDDSIQNQLSHLSPRYYEDWYNCRRKCDANEKCIQEFMDDGESFYINEKYSSDSNLLKKLFSTKGYPSLRLNGGYWKYLKYNSPHADGFCVNNLCVSKNLNCRENEILKSIDSELFYSHFQNCNLDSECTSIILPINCSEIGVSKKIIEVKNNNSSIMFNNLFIEPSRFENYASLRALALLESCGKDANVNLISECGNLYYRQPKIMPKCIEHRCVVPYN